MSFVKKPVSLSDIPEEKLNAVLQGAKDQSMIEPSKNVDVNDKRTQKPESVTNLIGKGATFESNFSRQTFYIHNDLIKRLDKLTKKAPRGEKTKIINAALEQYFNSLQQ